MYSLYIYICKYTQICTYAIPRIAKDLATRVPPVALSPRVSLNLKLFRNGVRL